MGNSKYFNNIRNGDIVYSLIYGSGTVENTLKKSNRIEGFYVFSVKFKNGELVHYTEDGVPNWCPSECGTQTLFFFSDIDFERVDFKPLDTEMSIKKIKKLRDDGSLEMQCPSGIWRNIEECPLKIVNDGIKKGKTNLFRLVKFVGKDRRKRG